MRRCLPVLFLLLCLHARAQHKTFRFAFISDTHIGSPDGSAEEDLRRTVRDINTMTDIAFVVITGDITELGRTEELQRAKKILDSLHVKWYIIPGNHDSGWSESGGLMFTRIFGSERFSFEYEGIRFVGCASGPYLRMSDGHVPRDAVNWLDSELKTLKKDQPLVFLNHYPINDQLDNWYEITDRLHLYNTWAILCGHGHTNKAFDFEGIPGVMGRSNLRAKQPLGGYNLVDVRNDSILFSERKPELRTLAPWTRVLVQTHHYDPDPIYLRPDFRINEQYPQVKEKWSFSSSGNIISTPMVSEEGNIIVGSQIGEMLCLDANGKKRWSYMAEGPVYSSPIGYKGKVIFGGADGYLYVLNEKDGSLIWKKQTNAPVLGSPVISGKNICIGGSEKYFAFDLESGNEAWSFPLEGPVMGSTTIYKNALVFGAWDTYLYCIDASTGKLIWKWNNGSAIRNYSPASCIPIIINDVVYVVAPDRYISAIDFNDGKTIWRNNDTRVRESNGVTLDGKWLYAKTMQDSIVAYRPSREKQSAAWMMNAGFGYEHVPSMLIEKQGAVFFGTRSGVVYSIDPLKHTVNWAHKIDNSMVNTVRPIDKKNVVVSTMDGKLVLLTVR